MAYRKPFPKPTRGTSFQSRWDTFEMVALCFGLPICATLALAVWGVILGLY